MTEAEAATKWCPQSRTSLGHPQGRCITSGCMVWRWTPHFSEPAEGDTSGYRRILPSINGYCGLAGAPNV